jgi:hypothetical protein
MHSITSSPYTPHKKQKSTFVEVDPFLPSCIYIGAVKSFKKCLNLSKNLFEMLHCLSYLFQDGNETSKKSQWTVIYNKLDFIVI